MVKFIKLATFTDLGKCKREDVNQLISALVRVGYEVYLSDKDYVTFKLGNDDMIEENKE